MIREVQNQIILFLASCTAALFGGSAPQDKIYQESPKVIQAELVELDGFSKPLSVTAINILGDFPGSEHGFELNIILAPSEFVIERLSYRLGEKRFHFRDAEISFMDEIDLNTVRIFQGSKYSIPNNLAVLSMEFRFGRDAEHCLGPNPEFDTRPFTEFAFYYDGGIAVSVTEYDSDCIPAQTFYKLVEQSS